MKTLDEIALHHGTDKATQHPLGVQHGYTIHYDKFFTPVRNDQINFLEIGVGGGESIRTWLEYFPNANVLGVDIVANTNPWNTENSGVHSRYKFTQGSQEDDSFWVKFLQSNSKELDIVVDDGGHTSRQIITTHKHLWPAIKPRGLYCIEDLNCAYASISGFCPEGWQNHMDFIKNKLDESNVKDEIEFLFYFKELAIFKKNAHI